LQLVGGAPLSGVGDQPEDVRTDGCQHAEPSQDGAGSPEGLLLEEEHVGGERDV